MRGPLGLVGGALLLILASYFFVRQSQGVLVEFPIALQAAGVVRSPMMRPSRNVEYLIEIEVDKNRSFEELNCLLGINSEVETCSSAGSVVDITWTLSGAGSAIGSGTSRYEKGAAWGKSISRTIGRFRVAYEIDCVLEVRSALNGQELAATNPRIVVRPHPMASKGTVVAAQAAMWIGMVLAVAGFLWAMVTVAMQRR